MRISDWSSDVCSSDLRRDEHGLGHAAGRLAMLGHIAGDFAAPRGMPDVHRIIQAKRLDDREGIGRIVIHVMAFGDLRRPAVPTAVMRNDTVPQRKKEKYLRIPDVRRNRPAIV